MVDAIQHWLAQKLGYDAVWRCMERPPSSISPAFSRTSGPCVSREGHHRCSSIIVVAFGAAWCICGPLAAVCNQLDQALLVRCADSTRTSAFRMTGTTILSIIYGMDSKTKRPDYFDSIEKAVQIGSEISNAGSWLGARNPA